MWLLKFEMCIVKMLLSIIKDVVLFKCKSLLLLVRILIKLLVFLNEGVMEEIVMVFVVVFLLNKVFWGLCKIFIEVIFIRLLMSVFWWEWYMLFIYNFIEDLKLKFCEEVLMFLIENLELVMFWFWKVVNDGM